MNIKNIRKLNIGVESEFTNSYAFGSGGGINFECDKVDDGSCELVLGVI